jgi:hypothetical protein
MYNKDVRYTNVQLFTNPKYFYTVIRHLYFSFYHVCNEKYLNPLLAINFVWRASLFVQIQHFQCYERGISYVTSAINALNNLNI